MTDKERIAELEAQLAAAKSTGNNPLRTKRTEKGGLSVYNLGRFPVTLYKEQWVRLLDFGPQIRKDIVGLPDKAK